MGGLNDTVTVSRVEHEQLVLDAGRWRAIANARPQGLLLWVPEYGSAEFEALAADDPRRYAATVRAAESWRTLNTSPHVAEILAEFMQWRDRRDLRVASHAISGALDWRREAEAPTYAELERRRAQPVVTRYCAGPGCRIVLSLPYPAPARDVYCHGHQERTQGVAA